MNVEGIGNKVEEEAKGHEDDHGKDMVDIYVNDVKVTIHRGHQTVAAIMSAGKVPSTDIIYLMPNYEVALDNNGSITIKGDERFKSSAPSGASS
jgi:hypothetical protein